MTHTIPMFDRRREEGYVHTANWPHFRSLAIQHLNDALAQIGRAEQCKPGCTGEAMMHVRLALAQLQPLTSPPLETKAADSEV